jgi:hypothetical protein
MKEKVQTKSFWQLATNSIYFDCNIDSVSDSSSEVKLDFEGDFNPMMAMMIKGPIGKFIETLAANMVNL